MASYLTGQIILTGFVQPLPGWVQCQGQLLPTAEYPTLFAAIGNVYGGDGQTNFAVPDLRGSLPIAVSDGGDKDHPIPKHAVATKGGRESVLLTEGEVPTHTHPLAASKSMSVTTDISGDVVYGSGIDPDHKHYIDPTKNTGRALLSPRSMEFIGGGQAHNNVMPTLGLAYWICVAPIEIAGPAYIGQIDWFGYGYTPAGYLTCDGNAYPIGGESQTYWALYAVIQTVFGEIKAAFDFRVPNLIGRAAAGVGKVPGGQINWALGTVDGQVTDTLTMAEYPLHNHAVQSVIGSPNKSVPVETVDGQDVHYAFGGFAPPISAARNAVHNKWIRSWIGQSGGGNPHENMQPYQVLTAAICYEGVFPFE